MLHEYSGKTLQNINKIAPSKWISTHCETLSKFVCRSTPKEARIIKRRKNNWKFPTTWKIAFHTLPDNCVWIKSLWKLLITILAPGHTTCQKKITSFGMEELNHYIWKMIIWLPSWLLICCLLWMKWCLIHIYRRCLYTTST